MYYVYVITALFRLGLYVLLILLLARQILPFVGKRPGEFERKLEMLTRPLLFAGDCFCRMLGIPLDREGIDWRYPVISVIVWIAVMAVSVG